MMKNSFLYMLLVFLFACTASEKQKNGSGLPFLGHHDIDPVNSDTVYHIVPPFAFENQDGAIITNDNVKGKIHVVNFFFTSCPSICPKMMSQLKRLQKLSDGMDIVILSYSVDPKRDSVPRLKRYADENGFSTVNWHLMTGDADEIYELGMTGYNLSAMEDESADGGFLHSEMVVLVDKKGRLRGMYEGTQTKAMDQLLNDIKKLQKEDE